MALSPRQVICPRCGAQLNVYDQRAAMVVCSSCVAVVDVRRPTPVLAGDQSPQLPPPSGTLRIGLESTFDDDRYRVVGYMLVRDDEYWRWNEWYLVGATGGERWISDDPEQGFVIWRPFMPALPIARDLLRAGQRFDLEGRSFRVTETAAAFVERFEGELPWIPHIGERLEGLEAETSGPGATWLRVEHDEDATVYYYGEKLSPRQLGQLLGQNTAAQPASGLGESSGAAFTGTSRRVSTTKQSQGVIAGIIGLILVCACGGFAFFGDDDDCPPLSYYQPVACTAQLRETNPLLCPPGRQFQPTPVPQRECLNRDGSIRAGSPGRRTYFGGGSGGGGGK